MNPTDHPGTFISHMKRIILILATLALNLPATAIDWPQWRGPNRDGVSTEKDLLDVWPEGGPRLLWKASGVGTGFSSVSVVKG